MLIEQIITERYVNLIGYDPKKERYKDEVFNILQSSYANIGGLASSGFESPDSMVEKIPFWKLSVKDGKVVAVIMYKDKNGRKAAAAGTDGTIAGKKAMVNMVRQEHKRSYVEKSKASLGLFMKSLPTDEAFGAIIPVDTVKKILPDEEIIPIKNLDPAAWPVDEDERESTLQTLQRYPELADYGYFRKLGKGMKFKVMIGTPYQKIV